MGIFLVDIQVYERNRIYKCNITKINDIHLYVCIIIYGSKIIYYEKHKKVDVKSTHAEVISRILHLSVRVANSAALLATPKLIIFKMCTVSELMKSHTTRRSYPQAKQ